MGRESERAFPGNLKIAEQAPITLRSAYIFPAVVAQQHGTEPGSGKHWFGAQDDALWTQHPMDLAEAVAHDVVVHVVQCPHEHHYVKALVRKLEVPRIHHPEFTIRQAAACPGDVARFDIDSPIPVLFHRDAGGGAG